MPRRLLVQDYRINKRRNMGLSRRGEGLAVSATHLATLREIEVHRWLVTSRVKSLRNPAAPHVGVCEIRLTLVPCLLRRSADGDRDRRKVEPSRFERRRRAHTKRTSKQTRRINRRSSPDRRLVDKLRQPRGQRLYFLCLRSAPPVAKQYQESTHLDTNRYPCRTFSNLVE